MKVISGSVTQPKGFKANGLSCGIKSSGKPDLGLIYSEVPAVTVGVFTKNSVKAAPVIVTQKHLKDSSAQALVVNSGNANCFTGEFGMRYAQETAKLFARLLLLKTSDIVIASTGIIGKQLPYKNIVMASARLISGLKEDNAKKFAKSMLTTDLKTKECAVEVKISGKKVKIGGVAKGSGMIEPNMATMLGFITTDAAISPELLKKALLDCTEDSFNSISVDGCMSTNDMVTVMANGEAGNKTISKAGDDYLAFVEGLQYVCLDLAKKIVLDGEGATKFIEVNVTGASNEKEAKKVARVIANNVLVKTACFGENPNWGRVAAAVGSAGTKCKEGDLKMQFSSFKKKEININVDLGLGESSARMYTSDLSYKYVEINGEYN